MDPLVFILLGIGSATGLYRIFFIIVRMFSGFLKNIFLFSFFFFWHSHFVYVGVLNSVPQFLKPLFIFILFFLSVLWIILFLLIYLKVFWLFHLFLQTYWLPLLKFFFISVVIIYNTKISIWYFIEIWFLSLIYILY